MILKSRSISYLQHFVLFTCVAVTIFYTVWANDKVIYGRDDRISIEQLHNSKLTQLGDITAAMVNWDDLVISKDSVSLTGKLLKKDRKLCEAQRFGHEMNPANCSGFLIAPDILVTAGHCIESFQECQDYAWVFDYTRSGKKLSYKKSIFRCTAILKQVYNDDDEKFPNDYAVIQLDRKVDRKIVPRRTSGKVSDKAKLIVIGHPSGLSQKVGLNGKVRDNSHPEYFSSNLDTFSGNSGSPIFDLKSGMIEGILVRGEEDYTFNNKRNCYEAKQCADDSCDGEDITRITNVLIPQMEDSIFTKVRSKNPNALLVIKKNMALINKVNIRNGNSLLIEAINAGNSTVAIFLLRQKSLDITSMNSANRDALTILAMLRDPKLKRVEKRLLKREDLSLDRIIQKKTPLMTSALFGNERMVKILLKRRANINQINQNGFNALLIALRHNQTSVAQMLVGNTDLSQRDRHNWSPILVAARYTNAIFVKQLLEMGLNLNDQNIHGYTPLMLSLANGDGEVFDLLVSNSAIDLDIQRANGDTAAHFAIRKREVDKFFTLVEKGARTDIKNNRKITAMDLLKKMNRYDLIIQIQYILESRKGDK